MNFFFNGGNTFLYKLASEREFDNTEIIQSLISLEKRHKITSNSNLKDKYDYNYAHGEKDKTKRKFPILSTNYFNYSNQTFQIRKDEYLLLYNNTSKNKTITQDEILNTKPEDIEVFNIFDKGINVNWNRYTLTIDTLYFVNNLYIRLYRKFTISPDSHKFINEHLKEARIQIEKFIELFEENKEYLSALLNIMRLDYRSSQFYTLDFDEAINIPINRFENVKDAILNVKNNIEYIENNKTNYNKLKKWYEIKTNRRTQALKEVNRLYQKKLLEVRENFFVNYYQFGIEWFVRNYNKSMYEKIYYEYDYINTNYSPTRNLNIQKYFKIEYIHDTNTLILEEDFIKSISNINSNINIYHKQNNLNKISKTYLKPIIKNSNNLYITILPNRINISNKEKYKIDYKNKNNKLQLICSYDYRPHIKLVNTLYLADIYINDENVNKYVNKNIDNIKSMINELDSIENYEILDLLCMYKSKLIIDNYKIIELIKELDSNYRYNIKHYHEEIKEAVKNIIDIYNNNKALEGSIATVLSKLNGKDINEKIFNEQFLIDEVMLLSIKKYENVEEIYKIKYNIFEESLREV